MRPSARTDETSLCMGCGLCCDGTLYDGAKVSPGEEKRMSAAGLDLFDSVQKRYFRLPCPHHSSCKGCMIYEARFDICRSYECALLKRAKAGDLSLAEAQQQIATAKALLSKVVAKNPGARTAANRMSIRAQLAADLQKGKATAAAEPLLDIISLDTFLERWFRRPHEHDSQRHLET